MSTNQSWKVIDKNFATLVQLYNYYSHTDSSELEEQFKKLLDKEFDINYRVPDIYSCSGSDWLVGYTIIELVGFTSELCQILIDRGADYTKINKHGSTHLLKNTENHDYESYIDSLKLQDSNKDFFANVILSAHINSGNYTNPKNKDGLSHFHVACIYNRSDVAKFFLENRVSINEIVSRDSTFCPGYSALHFAVKSCAFETVELLLSSGADMFAKDSKGMNPLHVLMVERRETFVRLKTLSRIASSDEKKLEYSNLCKYYTKNEKIIYLLLDRIKESGFCLDNDTGLSYFHVLCFMGNICILKQLLNNHTEYLTESVSMDSPIWPGYTPLHFAAHCNVDIVEFLVEKGADLSAKDIKGVTPFEMSLQEFSIADVSKILSLQPDYSYIVFSDGKTKLCDFIHAMQEAETFGSFLKDNLTDPNMFVPFNSPICAGYTPLHLTIICTQQPMSWSSRNHNSSDNLFNDLASKECKAYLSRVKLCLNFNADITSRDARGSTALHWAFRLQQSKAVHLLLERYQTSCNYIDEHGLSHFHIACAANNQAVVKKLLSGGANIDEVAKSSYTWLNITLGYTNDLRFSNRVHKHFINEGSTPLHFASSAKCPEIVEILVNHGADVLARDMDGLNPFERLIKLPVFQDPEYLEPCQASSFISNEDEIAKTLVRKIGDRLVDTKPKQMLYCYSLLEDELLSEILSQHDESAMKILKSVGITALHVACFTRNFSQVNRLVDENDVNARVNLDSPLWPGCTPLHLLANDQWNNPFSNSPMNKVILETLLKSGADVAAVNAKGETSIHQMFSFDRPNNFTSHLLENLKDFSVNPTSARGFTHLHIASACGAVSIVEKLLKHGAIIDQPTDYFTKLPHSRYEGSTALHLAAAYRQEDVVDVLLKHGADVNCRDAEGGNPLHASIYEFHEQQSLKLLQTLIGAGADIDARDMFGYTPFFVLIKSPNCTKEIIELFLENGCSVNTFNRISDEGLLAIALKKSRRELPIFELLVKAPRLKDINHNGRNAIHNAVSFKRPDWHDLFLRGIFERYTSPNDYVKGIDSLMKLILNIDQQDSKGLTPLHVAAQMQNHSGIVGLLENGADINIVDTNGKTAFAYSLELAQLHEEPKHLDIYILEIISMHMYKVNLAKIGMSMSNRQVNRQIHEIDRFYVPIIEGCDDEVEEMRKEKISSTSVTFYEFLSDTGAVSAFPYMSPCSQMAIISFFKNETESLRKNYPEFAGILLLQCQKALARCHIIDPAVTSIDILVGFNMPAVCSRIILRFLSNDELTNLISAGNNE